MLLLQGFAHSTGSLQATWRHSSESSHRGYEEDGERKTSPRVFMQACGTGRTLSGVLVQQLFCEAGGGGRPGVSLDGRVDMGGFGNGDEDKGSVHVFLTERYSFESGHAVVHC